ncbi:MAG: hypothetical protein JWL72_2976 [Ilumatobacteraceae bacterium]|nr:hypothetical protein [Ilumatobacteraceae bacterium]
MIDPDDLALLATSFAAAMSRAPGAAEADDALHDLGWGELLAHAPLQGAAAAFSALGVTGSAACLLDDVAANALGLPVSASACVVLPAPSFSRQPAERRGQSIHIDGLVSARIDRSDRAMVAVSDGSVVEVDAALLRTTDVIALDPQRPFRRLRVDVCERDVVVLARAGSWDTVILRARAAVAHQLVAASRVMLDQATQHAVDRVQFGRPIASFQAVRHRLADALVAIEGASAVTEMCAEDECDPLMATMARSLAGAAARTTAASAQQVLAGIGFTTDHPFHLSLKRTMVLDTLFGSARTLPTEIGNALLAIGGAPRLIEL